MGKNDLCYNGPVHKLVLWETSKRKFLGHHGVFSTDVKSFGWCAMSYGINNFPDVSKFSSVFYAKAKN